MAIIRHVHDSKLAVCPAVVLILLSCKLWQKSRNSFRNFGGMSIWAEIRFGEILIPVVHYCIANHNRSYIALKVL